MNNNIYGNGTGNENDRERYYYGSETESQNRENAQEGAGETRGYKYSISPGDGDGHRDGEYRLNKSQIPGPEYRDPNYRDPSYSQSSTQNGSSLFPQNSNNNNNSKKARGRRTKNGGIGPGPIVAMALVCAIIGGLAGGVVGYRSAPQETEETNMSSDVIVPDATQSSQESDVTASPSVVSAGGGAENGVLDTTEIYDLACIQTVGITTEVTEMNIFGQVSTAAVSGSGFIVSSDGYIITNYHVIETAVKGDIDISVMLYSGEIHIAEVVGFEAENDVAVLKIDAENLPAATFGDSDAIEVGQPVYAVGNPLGELSYTMTSGMLSALDRDITTDSENGINTINMFQFDAAVNSGNSGGPLYNAKGEVIGVVTAKYSSSGVEGLGFAIPINDARYIMEEFINNGYVSGKPSFGISVNTVSSSVAQYYNMVVGAYVYSMDENGSCARAGIEIGDIITQLGDTEITSSIDLRGAKKNYSAGDSASIVVFRNGEYLEYTIVFDEETPDIDSSSYATAGQDNDVGEGYGEERQDGANDFGYEDYPGNFGGLFPNPFG